MTDVYTVRRLPTFNDQLAQLAHRRHLQIDDFDIFLAAMVFALENNPRRFLIHLPRGDRGLFKYSEHTSHSGANIRGVQVGFTINLEQRIVLVRSIREL